jgi:hypothetical protein
MHEQPSKSDHTREFTDLELAYVGGNLANARRYLVDQRLLYESLVIGFVLGLIAHTVGFFLAGASPTTDLIGLLADLLYAAGLALWTGVVLVIFTQVFPEMKRRQIKRAIEEYEALRDRK